MTLTCAEWGGIIILSYISSHARGSRSGAWIIHWLLLGAGLFALHGAEIGVVGAAPILISAHFTNTPKWPEIVLHTGVPAHFRSLMSMHASPSGNPVGLWRGGGSGPRAVPHHVGMCPEIAAVGLRRFEAPCRSSYVALAALQARHHHADLNQHRIPALNCCTDAHGESVFKCFTGWRHRSICKIVLTFAI